LVAAVSIRLVGLIGLVEVEGLVWNRVAAFAVTPLATLATLWANMRILRYANVETFIMVRSTTPLATSLLDWMFLNRELPGARSVIALLVSLIGASGYMICDSTFSIQAYSWAVAWLVIFLFDQTYIKHVVTKIEMSTWTRSYYTNAIAGGPVLLYAALVEGAPGNLASSWSGSPTIGAVMLAISCALGTAMSFFAFGARAAVSATSFTVAGNACKVLSVVINVLIWDKHATLGGIMSLGVCLVGAIFYQQAPLRGETPNQAQAVHQKEVDEDAEQVSSNEETDCLVSSNDVIADTIGHREELHEQRDDVI